MRSVHTWSVPLCGTQLAGSERLTIDQGSNHSAVHLAERLEWCVVDYVHSDDVLGPYFHSCGSASKLHGDLVPETASQWEVKR